MSIEQPFWPDYLSASDEVTHRPPDIPLWSENYLSQAYAPGAQLGFWFHLGRSSYDVNLWCEIFVVYLPGDQFLVARNYSYGETDAGPLGNQLHYRCEEPFKRWKKTFNGAANLVSGKQLRTSAFAAGPTTHVDLELNWNSLGPAFDLGALGSNESWSKAHYEQHGTVSGLLKYDEKDIAFNGSGIRDHSWGPRDFDRFNTHAWMNAQFPDGETFQIFHVVDIDGNSGTHATVGDAVSYCNATLLSPPPLITQVNQVDSAYDILLETDDGRRLDIKAEILQAATMSIGGKSELMFGQHQKESATQVLLEAQTKFTLNGKVGYGLTDRTIKIT